MNQTPSPGAGPIPQKKQEPPLSEQLKEDYGDIKQPEQGSTLDERATEQQLATLLKDELPPIRCGGEQWFVFENGTWRKTSRDIYKSRALSIQHPNTRTARKANNVLNHVEYQQQANVEEFHSFYCFEKHDTILINCTNGVLRLSQNKVILEPHQEGRLFAGQLAGSYRPGAKANIFRQVLLQTLPDPEDAQLFELFAGYLLFPDCRFETALVCYGPGGTGKGTLISGLEAVIGAELCRHLSLDQICNPQSKLLAQLKFAAVNIATELNAIETVGGETFKQLVSGERVQADRKYLSDISLQTACKFLFATNYLPRFQHGTDAELRRLRFLKFDHKPEVVDNTLKSRIAEERDGIFLWMLEGLQKLLRNGQFPEGGKKAAETRARFKVQNDSIGAFVDECCQLRSNNDEIKEDVYKAYEEFCQANGIPPFEASPFFRELYARCGLRGVRRRDGDQRIQRVVGITLKE
jgi:putative DNA primase/helicase